MLRALVACKLALDWSPQQIAGWLKVEYPDEPDMQVSHETIYLTLLIQARGALRRELIAHLRRLRAVRRPKGALSNSRGQGQIEGVVSIRERPAKGGGPGDPRSLGGRPTGRLGQHPSGNARRASLALCDAREGRRRRTPAASWTPSPRRSLKLPTALCRSLTFNRGTELARHKQFTIATDVVVYFCDPRSPWQRGSNENTNGLLRQYLPKGTDLSRYSQDALDAISLKLNTRPRKTLGYMTPAAKLDEVLR